MGYTWENRSLESIFKIQVFDESSFVNDPHGHHTLYKNGKNVRMILKTQSRKFNKNNWIRQPSNCFIYFCFPFSIPYFSLLIFDGCFYNLFCYNAIHKHRKAQKKENTCCYFSTLCRLGFIFMPINFIQLHFSRHPSRTRNSIVMNYQ